MAYHIVYGDLTVFSSEDGGDPPPRDVQVIVQPHRDAGWHTQAGRDFYVWRAEQDRWVAVDWFGLFDWLLDSGKVLFGRTLTGAEFDAAMRVAMKIRDVEREKTGWTADERRPAN